MNFQLTFPPLNPRAPLLMDSDKVGSFACALPLPAVAFSRRRAVRAPHWIAFRASNGAADGIRDEIFVASLAPEVCRLAPHYDPAVISAGLTLAACPSRVEGS